jgi:type III secretory pathway component EscS
MKKIFTFLILAVIGCQFANAKSINDNTDKIKALEEKCYVLQKKQVKADNNLRKLIENQHVAERKIQTLVKKNDAQRLAIDSLQDKCKSLEEAQSTDRENINGKIDATDNNVRTNQDQLQSRTLYGVIVVIVVLAIIVGVACWLTKRIKSGTSTIGDVRRAQEALQAAQTKMQEESIQLDNQLLAIVQKQLDAYVPSANKTTGEPDHSLVVKLADEIARIETNLSKMDKSVRGYKQLVQAKDRMINNVRANGYEIISLLGQEYNDGMQFQTRFVPDESLPEGKRIITGMIKMQVNYNGKMIQPAEIVVSQNI